MTRFRIRELLQESRKKGKKVTQVDLAKAAKVHQVTISHLMNNKIQNPRIDVLLAIASFFTGTLGRLIRIDDLIEHDYNTIEPDHNNRIPRAVPTAHPEIDYSREDH